MTAVLPACGSDDGAPAIDPVPSASVQVVIRGTVQGIAQGTSIIVTNNGADPVSLSADGAFAFPTRIESTRTYRVAISAVSTGQACSVLYATGSAATIDTGGPAVICGPVSRGMFQVAADPPGNRVEPKMVALRDDSVLVFGGSGDLATGGDPVREVARFAVASNRWSGSGSIPGNSRIHGVFPVLDDQVLLLVAPQVTGGKVETFRYDPATTVTTTRTPATTLTTVAFAIALRDGRVMASDGALVEIYDPTLDRWVVVEPLPRAGTGVVLCGNGNVLVMSPPSEYYDPLLLRIVVADAGATQVFDVTTGQWSVMGSTVETRKGPVLVALADGEVLAIGGTHVVGAFGRASFDDARAGAEIFDPVAGQWRAAGTFDSPRERFTATLMPDGRVLVAGGNVVENDLGLVRFPRVSLDSVQAYDPRTNAWSAFGKLSTTRTSHGAVRTASGKLFVSGGFLTVYATHPTFPYESASQVVSTSEVGW